MLMKPCNDASITIELPLLELPFRPNENLVQESKTTQEISMREI